MPMSRQEVITRLKAAEPQIPALGVSAFHLYGSDPRDDADDRSDLDVMVDFEQDKGDGLSAFLKPYQLVEDNFPGIETGCGTRDSLEAQYRNYVEQGAIRVF